MNAPETQVAAVSRVLQTVRVNEIFVSLQGETSRTGLPTVFVRLTGCPMRCSYCDTEYAFDEGRSMAVAEVMEEVARHGVRIVTVTGGEPLAQKGCLTLLAALCHAGYSVSLETGGGLDISDVDPRVSKILDIKTPGSGEAGRNRWENLACMGRGDEFKFVVCDGADYEWAKRTLSERGLADIAPVLVSPAWGLVNPKDLAEWILRDRLPVRMQIQLHKLLWGTEPGH